MGDSCRQADAQRWRERVQEMTNLAENAGAERELAIYRAEQQGVPVSEIAHLALTTCEEVERIVTAYRNDPESDSLSYGPDWVRIYRH